MTPVRIVFFGAGDVAQRVFKSLIKENVNILAFIDENAHDPAKNIKGLPIVNFKQLAQIDFNYIFVAVKDTDIAFNKLTKLGIAKHKLVSVNFVGEAYRLLQQNTANTPLPLLIQTYIESVPVLKSVINLKTILNDIWIKNEQREMESLNRFCTFTTNATNDFSAQKYFYQTPDVIKAELDTLRIESTAFCSYSCYFCAAKDMQRKRGTMSLDALKLILERVGDFTGTVHLHHSGEPLLDKDLGKKVALIRKAWPKCRIGMNTTLGVPVTSSFLDELWQNGLNIMFISFYGYSKEEYQQIHGVPLFDLAKKNIEYSLKSKTRINTGGELHFRMLHMEETGNYGEAYIATMNEFGAEISNAPNVTLQDCFVMSYAGQTVLRENSTILPCSVVWGNFRRELNITWNLNVVPCCLDSDDGIVLGNLQESSLEDIFASERYKHFASSHWNNDLNNYPICKSCEKHIGGYTNEFLALAFAKISSYLHKTAALHTTPIAFVGDPLIVERLGTLFSQYSILTMPEVLQYCSAGAKNKVAPYIFFAARKQGALMRLKELEKLFEQCTGIKPSILPVFGAGYDDSRELAAALAPYAKMWNV